MTAEQPSLVEVAPGVWAYVQLDGGWYLNNTGFVVGRDGIVAIDATSTVRRNQALLAAMRSVSDRPVRVLVNTHHHGDHTHGNAFFPAAAVVAHEACRREVVDAGLMGQLLFPDVEWGELRVAPPFLTFATRITVWSDELAVELEHVGPAHTTNDVFAWIPERRVLFAGDLVFHHVTPFALQGSLRGWLTALTRLRELDPEVVVPGHGPVGDASSIDAVAGYLRWVEDLAAEGFAAGRSPVEVAQRTDLGAYAGWRDAERLVVNLHRAYSELRGEPPGAPLEAATVLGDVLTCNGGPPTSDA